MFTIAPRAVTGTVTLPDPAGKQVTVPNSANDVILTVNLQTADKLSDGKTVSIQSWFSNDAGQSWQFINSTNWVSYGAAGSTIVDPDGTVNVNPDPRLFVPLNGLSGMLIRTVIAFGQTMTAGLTVSQ